MEPARLRVLEAYVAADLAENERKIKEQTDLSGDQATLKQLDDAKFRIPLLQQRLEAIRRTLSGK